ENLRFWARVYGAPSVDVAMDAFDLGGLRDRLGGTLSAGQQRRCGLARLALSGRPLWLLDEPTVSLDAAAQGMLADAVAAHLSDGGMAILTSHVPLPMETARLDLTPFRATRQAATLEAFGEALE
ncbi:MAG: ATP-binding cassette domain-containing protein, partial [Pseudomonadota bacterium]